MPSNPGRKKGPIQMKVTRCKKIGLLQLYHYKSSSLPCQLVQLVLPCQGCILLRATSGFWCCRAPRGEEPRAKRQVTHSRDFGILCNLCRNLFFPPIHPAAPAPQDHLPLTPCTPRLISINISVSQWRHINPCAPVNLLRLTSMYVGDH